MEIVINITNTKKKSKTYKNDLRLYFVMIYMNTAHSKAEI